MLLLALPFAGSAVAALLPTHARNLASAWAGFIALATALPLALLFPEVVDGGVLRERIEWLPSLGVDLVLRLDGFAWMFAMLVIGIGALVVLYARYYMSPDGSGGALLTRCFLGFMGAMLGVVLSGNLIQLVLFWELTSLFSFLLIGYWHHRARRAARRAHGAHGHRRGRAGLLAGVLVLGRIVGSYDLDAVLGARATVVRAPPALPAGAGAGAARRADQERAVPVPLLAAARDGRADAGLGLPALGDHGQGRRVPAGAAVAGARRHRALVLDRRRRRARDPAARRLLRRCSRTT